MVNYKSIGNATSTFSFTDNNNKSRNIQFRGQSYISSTKPGVGIARAQTNAVISSLKLGLESISDLKDDIIQLTINTSSSSTVILAEDEYNYPWNTTNTLLNYNDKNIKLQGISLEGIEYIAKLQPSNTFYDFTNMCITSNLITFINKLQNFSNPLARISLNADYLINGSGNSALISFTGKQYQQCIIDIISALTSMSDKITVSNNGTIETLTVKGISQLSIILALKYNYTSLPTDLSNSLSNTSSDNSALANSLSGGQLPLPGYCIKTTTPSGIYNSSLSDNTLQFWRRLTILFGIKQDGNPLNPNNTLDISVLENIFFELYSNPSCDKLTTVPNEIQDNTYGSYLSYYDAFVNGGKYYTYGTSNLYSFTGMKTIYNAIRSLNAINVCIVNGSDFGGCVNLTTPSPIPDEYKPNNDQPGQFILSDAIKNGATTIYDTYNCFSQFKDSVGKKFSNVIFSIQPFIGLHHGVYNSPGLYNTTYSKYNEDGTLNTPTNIPGLGQIFKCLQNKSFELFSISNPIMCSEFGSFDLPWNNYSSTDINDNPLLYSYNISGVDKLTIYTETGPVNYINPLIKYPNPPNNSYTIPINIQSPYYNGTWINSNTNELMFSPSVIGYYNDFEQFNISSCLYSWRPNSSGNGNALGCDDSTNGWAATNCDLVAGSSQYSGDNINNPCGMTDVESEIINFNITKNTQNSTFPYNSIISPYNGPNVQYILDNFIE